ncbi:hypothetical protein Q9966_008713 [Columba livia]|nr:hypothetical protein Q9966_008713 [Columba livia]
MEGPRSGAGGAVRPGKKSAGSPTQPSRTRCGASAVEAEPPAPAGLRPLRAPRPALRGARHRKLVITEDDLTAGK